jgi:hypothetical protein
MAGAKVNVGMEYAVGAKSLANLHNGAFGYAEMEYGF